MLAAPFVQIAVSSPFVIGVPAPRCRKCSARWSRSGVGSPSWLTDRQFSEWHFSELHAITQAAPGPNVMFVALLGHFIAGTGRS
jgi:hypothetical protein